LFRALAIKSLWGKFICLALLLHVCAGLNAQPWANVISTMPGSVNRIFYTTVQDTTNKILYLGGNFNSINQYQTNGIIKFDGNLFTPLGTGLDDQFPGSTATDVKHLTMYNGKLYVFGNFAKAGPVYSRWMARWNGTAWDNWNFKAKGPVRCATVLNSELYVAGLFDSIGGIAANCVAKYNGNTWTALDLPVKNNQVAGLAAYKGKIYMAGQTTASSPPATVMFYDGTNWQQLATAAGATNKAIYGLKVIDSMLYVYGRFTDINGTYCRGLAAYNGTRWYGFGQGVSTGAWESIYNVEKINGELYVSGEFDKIEGIGTSSPSVLYYTNLAKYSNQSWCAISPPFERPVYGVTEFKGNLYSYGSFRGIGIDTCIGFMRWNGGLNPFVCSQPVTVYISGVHSNGQVSELSVKLFPNPSHTFFVVENAQQNAGEPISIEIFNGIGQVVSAVTSTEPTVRVNSASLTPGVYIVKIATPSGSRMLRLIKS